MNRTVKQIWRYGKWPLFLGMLIVAFWLWFVPFAKWVFVGKTLEVYKEVAEEYAADDDAVTYQGVITDTLIHQSAKVKGKTDTVVHRQAIQLAPQAKPADGKPRMEDVGVFGDSAGLLNAFFSFLAFMAVLLTIYLQSRKDGHDKQNGARVLFEQEFFAMMGMLENIVAHLKFTDRKPVEDKKIINDIVAHYYQGMGIGLGQNDEDEDQLPDPVVVEGREVFKYIYADRDHYNLLQYVSKEKDLRQSAQAQEMCFDGTLDHYFRYLYRILKHIDKSELLGKLDEPEKEREYYAHLLRAQLSNYELLMLFYNGLLGENPHTIKLLIEKYAMFNNLRAWELGKFQKEYYQAIQDEYWYEDPEGYDAETSYSVRAFWDGEKRKEFKAQAQKEKRGEKFGSWIKGWRWRKTSEKPAAAGIPAEPVEAVESEKRTESSARPAKPVKQKYEKKEKKEKRTAGKAESPKNLEEKRRGKQKK